MDERTITAVRRRPAMYIGGTDKTGLHQLPCQVLDFMAFGHHANHTTQIHLTIHPDHSIAIEDDAIRPIPRDTDVLSYFHHLPDNIFSLGLSIVQALCEWFIFETWQGDSSYRQKFRSGLVDGQADTFSPTSPHGTRIWFRPDPAILADITDLSFYWLAGRSRHHCACNADLKIRLDDKRANLTAQYQYAEGLKSYLQEIQEGSLYFSSSIPPMIHLKTDIDSGYAEVAFCWSHRLRGRSYALHSFIHDVRTLMAEPILQASN
jgi:DNA gyrase subunit B